ncbi:MAG: dehydrogenase [Lentisphaerae bacterium GWF2_49_21]|nr:MAG: dehydrogenase [Lentisphaerae bacterium GWF2_49_21]
MKFLQGKILYMKKLRIGVIGLGMGSGHIKGYRTHDQAEVVAVADTDPKRLEERGKKEFNIPSLYTSAEEMLAKEKLDVVSIATPNKFHRPLTLAAFKAGCHVLCEKPMAMNAQEARDMLAASKKARKRLMINFSFRFTEQSYAMKQQVEKGILGDIYYARTQWLRRRGMPGFGGWFGQKALAGGGPLIDLGVHRLDLALWLMDYPKPVWVMGNTFNHIATERAKAEKKTFDVEDMAAGFIKFKNGAALSLEASWAGNIKDREFMHTQLLGTKAGLHQYNLNEGYNFECEFYMEKDGCQYDMKLHPPVPQAKNAMYHFIDSIVNGTPNIATGEEGLIVMEILDALYKSAAEGCPVKIK